MLIYLVLINGGIRAIRILVFYLIFFVSSVLMYGQHQRWRPGTDSLQVITNEDRIYEALIDNLSMYMITQYISTHNEQYSRGFGNISMIREALPPCNQYDMEYDIQLRPVDFVIPDEFIRNNFTILEYRWPHLQMRSWFRGRERVSTIGGKMPDYYSPLADRGIIAISKDSSSILYISGYMFLDNICSYYFPKGHLDETLMRDYIMLRFYNYEPEIKNVDIEKGECVFYSRVVEKKYRVRIIHKPGTHDGEDRGKTWDEIEEIL